MTWYILSFIFAFLVLARASNFLVKSLTGLARFFKISEYMVAFVFMSLITSLPELFVGISSAINNIPEFSLGNILGANLLKITLMMGFIVFLGGGLRIDSKISRRNFWVISVFAFLPLLLGIDGLISRGDGCILLIAFLFYLLRLKRDREYFTKTINHHKKNHSVQSVFKQFSRSFWGIVLLMLSSYVIVWSGKYLAQEINLSLLSFGILFVAVGTSLPELVFGIRAKMMKHHSMAIGNALGSIAFNSMLVIGLVALIEPITVSFTVSLFSVVSFSILAFIFFNAFVFSKSVVTRKEGLVLLSIYVMFLIFEYLVYLY